jgi:hypothetical protein
MEGAVRARSALIAVLSVLVLALVPAAATAAVTWSGHVAVDDSSHHKNSIDCPTVTLCVIGGDDDRIATSTNPTGDASSWQAGAVPNATTANITAVSCSSADLCTAVDDDGNVMYSTNPAGGAATWHIDHLMEGANDRGFSGLSCPGSDCVAADRSRNAILAGPPASATTWMVEPTDYTPGDVSCNSTVCVLTHGGGIYTASSPSGPWTRTSFLPNPDSIVAVSCVAAFCVGGGSGSINGANIYWSTNPTGGKDAWPREILTSSISDVECVTGATSSLCSASTDFGKFIWTSTNPTGGASAWTKADIAADSNEGVADVSCPTNTTCFAALTLSHVVVGTNSGGDPGGGDPGGGDPGGGDPGGGGPGGGDPGGGGNPGGGDPSGGGTDPFAGAKAKPSYNKNGIGFFLEVSTSATGFLRGVTQHPYVFSKPAVGAARAKKGRRVSLGSVNFKLKANKRKLVTLKYTKKVRKLIAKKKKVPVKFTISLKDTAGHTKVIKKTLTLKAPRKKK